MSLLMGRSVTVTVGPGTPYDAVFLEFVPSTPPANVIALVERAGVVSSIGISDFIFTDSPPGPYDMVRFQVVRHGATSLLFATTRTGHLYVTKRKNIDVAANGTSETHQWRKVYAPVE